MKYAELKRQAAEARAAAESLEYRLKSTKEELDLARRTLVGQLDRYGYVQEIAVYKDIDEMTLTIAGMRSERGLRISAREGIARELMECLRDLGLLSFRENHVVEKGGRVVRVIGYLKVAR